MGKLLHWAPSFLAFFWICPAEVAVASVSPSDHQRSLNFQLLKADADRFESSQLTETLISQRVNPQQDPFFQSDPENLEPIPEDADPILPEQPEAPIETIPPSTGEDLTVNVSRIEVTGSTVFTVERLELLLDEVVPEGQMVTFQQLKAAANAITQLYISNGYITSFAILPEQDIVDGVVQIQVIEGQLEDIQIEGLERLQPGYVLSRLRRGLTSPVNTQNIEEQLFALRLSPLLDSDREKFGGRLEPGTVPGQSILVVTVEEVKAWSFGVGIDNYSPPSVGSERLSANFTHRNLSGWGETLSATYYRTTTGGSEIWDFGYRLPLNPMEGDLSLRAYLNDNEVTQGQLSGLVEGNSELYEIQFRQPLIQSLREELALSVGFSYRDGSTFFNLPNLTNNLSESRTSVFQFGQDYTRRDTQGVWALRSQFNFGTGLLDATSSSIGPDGQYFSWLGQVQRAQRLGDDHLLLVGIDLQLTPDSLLPSEQFIIGGGQSLRGYRQNVRAGDNGFRFSIEDRITAASNDSVGTVLQVIPFLDMGAVWNNAPNLSVPDNFLVGTGLGFVYTPLEGLNLRLDYGIPVVSIPDKQTNLQDNGLYFSVSYTY